MLLRGQLSSVFPRQLHRDAVFARGFGKSLGAKYKKINSFARPNFLEFDTEMTKKLFSFLLWSKCFWLVGFKRFTTSLQERLSVGYDISQQKLN